MTVNHLSEFFIRLQSLPLEAGVPVIEKASRPPLTLVALGLAERFLEQISGIEPFVPRQQGLQCPPVIHAQVLAVRQQGVFLSLDETALFASQSCVLSAPHFIQRIIQMAYNVKLVEQDRRLMKLLAIPLGCQKAATKWLVMRRLAGCCVVKRFPHIHHRQASFCAFLRPKPIMELHHARFGSILPAKPDGPATNQVAHHDAVSMPLANCDSVDANRLGARGASTSQLYCHVLLVQLLDRVPVQVQLASHIIYGGTATTPTNVKRKPLRVQRVVGKEVEPLPFHLAATSAMHTANLDLQIDPRICARQVANSSRATVVPLRMHQSACTTDSFFERGSKVIIRAFGSPNTPRTLLSGRKPGNVYASRRRLDLDEVVIATSCQNLSRLQMPICQYGQRLQTFNVPFFTHTIMR